MGLLAYAIPNCNLPRYLAVLKRFNHYSSTRVLPPAANKSLSQ
ncbi:MAG: hypothetical protein N6V49_02375 [Serratia symbiotica]|nr:hypothetical protein [Serratia symbiotica]